MTNKILSSLLALLIAGQPVSAAVITMTGIPGGSPPVAAVAGALDQQLSALADRFGGLGASDLLANPAGLDALLSGLRPEASPEQQAAGLVLASALVHPETYSAWAREHLKEVGTLARPDLGARVAAGLERLGSRPLDEGARARIRTAVGERGDYQIWDSPEALLAPALTPRTAAKVDALKGLPSQPGRVTFDSGAALKDASAAPAVSREQGAPRRNGLDPAPAGAPSRAVLEARTRSADPFESALAFRDLVRQTLETQGPQDAAPRLTELEREAAGRAPAALQALADLVQAEREGGVSPERREQLLDTVRFWEAQAEQGAAPLPPGLAGLSARVQGLPERGEGVGEAAEISRTLAAPAREAFYARYLELRARGFGVVAAFSAAAWRSIEVWAGGWAEYLRDLRVTNWKKFLDRLKGAHNHPAPGSLLPADWANWPVADSQMEVSRPQAKKVAGYSLAHAPEGLAADPAPRAGVSVRVWQGPPADEALLTRFDAFNDLIEKNFSALPLITKNAQGMNRRTAESIYAKVRAMAEDYVAISGDRGPLEELGRIWAQLQARLAGLTDLGQLDQDALDMVVPPGRPSLHQMIQRLHQKAVEQSTRVGGSFPPNVVVEVSREGEAPRRVTIINVARGTSPLIREGRILSPALKALVDMLAHSKRMPEGALFLQGDQLWAHFQLGWHSVEVYVALRDVDEGGIVRARYQEWDTHMLANRSRLRYIREAMAQLGASVGEEKGFLTATVDKDHRSQTPDQMAQTASLALQVLNATTGVDYALPLVMSGRSLDEKTNGDRVAQWAALALAEGGLPFFSAKDIENPPASSYPRWMPAFLRQRLLALEKWFSFSLRAMAQGKTLARGFLDYLNQNPARRTLRRALNLELARLGLLSIPETEILGQRTIDRLYDGRIDAALARGEIIREAGGRLVRNPRHSPVASLAAAAAGNPADLSRMAEVVGSLDPALFTFETLGSAGKLLVQRAQRRLDPDNWLVLEVLRDPQTLQVAFARAELDSLSGARRRLGWDEVFTRLAEQGHPVASFKPSEDFPGAERYLKMLRSAPEPDPEGAILFRGLAVSPGAGRPVVARVTFEKETAVEGGRVFVAEYTEPDDIEAIRNSKAVLTFSGGKLSHAAITTRELGIPAVVLSQGVYTPGEGVSLGFPLFSPTSLEGGIHLRRTLSTGFLELKEGDVIRVDPRSGSVEVLDSHRQTALLEVAEALAAFEEKGDQASLSAWVRGWIASPVHHPRRRMARLNELLSALAARLGDDPDAEAAYARLREGLLTAAPKLGPPLAAVEGAILAGQVRAAQKGLEQIKEMAPFAESVDTVEGLAASARRLGDRLAALQRTLSGGGGGGAAADSIGRITDLLAQRKVELQRATRLQYYGIEQALAGGAISPEEGMFRLRALLRRAAANHIEESVYAPWRDRLRLLEGGRAPADAALIAVPLGRIGSLGLSASDVGGKNFNLAEIERIVAEAGAHTSPGLALTVQAYRRFLSESGIQAQLVALAQRSDLSVEAKAEKAKELILSRDLADLPVGREIMSQVKDSGLGLALAVRSSAVDEDGSEQAFAGAGDTRLFVPNTPAAVLRNVQEVWASVWNARALAYREEQARLRGVQADFTQLSQAVVVQAMVPSEVSGVGFSRDPVTGHPGRVVYNASFGLGEGIVSGLVTPDEFVVDKRTGGEVIPAIISYKNRQVAAKPDGPGTYEPPVPAHQRRLRSLGSAELRLLTRVVSALESHYGHAVDIEFAFVGGRLYILQARPVTTR